jgi:hypothetical protein
VAMARARMVLGETFAVCAVFAAAIAVWRPAMAAGPSPVVPPPAGTGTAAGMTGEIRGTVVDHTTPSHPVGGQLVRLEITEPGFNSTRTTTTDRQGRYAFPGLPVGGTRVFLVQVHYGGVPYSVRVALTPAARVHEVPLAVFAATNDRTVVSGTIALVVLESLHDALRLSVVQRFNNATDRAVAATDQDPLVVPLPQLSPAPRASVPVEFIDGWRAPRVLDGTITDALPLLPGATEVAYAFGVEPGTRATSVLWEFPHGATDVEILADPGLKLSGAAVRARGVIDEHGRRYARWSAGPLPREGAVSFRIEGLPVRAEGRPEIVAAVFGLVLAAGLAMALRRRPAVTSCAGSV